MFPCPLSGNGKELYKLLLRGLSFSWWMWSDFQARLKSSGTCPEEPLWCEVEMGYCSTSKLAKHCATGCEQREVSWLLLSCHFGLFTYAVNCFVKYIIIWFLPSTHWNKMGSIRLLLLLETRMWYPLKKWLVYGHRLSDGWMPFCVMRLASCCTSFMGWDESSLCQA